MSDRTQYLIHLTCILGTGLMAGTFFAFSSFIMEALGRLPPSQGISTMQSINITVINPLFMAVLFGTAVSCVFVGYVALGSDAGSGSIFGAALYAVGVIGVTMVFNVPLNNELAGLDPAATSSAAVWTRFLATWSLWNSVRGLSAAAACVAFAASL